MKRLLSLFFILLLLAWGVKAYQVHTSLTTPSRVLQLIKHNESEELIGAYVKEGTLGPKWQLIFYNPNSQKIRIVSLSEKLGLIPGLLKETYLNPTPYNYSPLSTNLERLKDWDGKTPALLFHEKWYYKLTFQGIRNFQNIQSENLTLLGIFYSKNSFWMGVQGIRVCNADFSYPQAGPGGIIVPPNLAGDGAPTVLATVRNKGNHSETSIVFFDGSTINITAAVHPECIMAIFADRLGMVFCGDARKEFLKETHEIPSCPFELKDVGELTQIWYRDARQNPSKMAMFVARPVKGTSKDCSAEIRWVVITLKGEGYCGDEYSGKLENT